MAARLESQELASKAYERVESIVRERELAKAKKALEEIRKVPSRIQASGLGQTLAFYLKKKDHQVIADALVFGVADGAPKALEYLAALMGAGTTAGRYRVTTRRALAYASWLKRFADARLASAPFKSP